MARVVHIDSTALTGPRAAAEQARAVDALESGHVLLLPALAPDLTDPERTLLSPRFSGERKNVSLDPAGRDVSGASGSADERELLRGLMERFARHSRALLARLAPGYEPALQRWRTSYRPVEIAGRATSWRKDDTRLHVDSFPSSPTAGRRILRVFANINPDGHSRAWRIGGSFDTVARRYLALLDPPVPGSARLMQWIGLTRARRTRYDHFMLQLHDRMKADAQYQSHGVEHEHAFAPGDAWMVFTDQVPHAAVGGQYALEQTFYLPVEAMKEPGRSPLRVLEGMMGRRLV